MLDLLEFERSDKILEPVMPDGTGYGKICELPIATHAKALAECCKKAFDCTVVRYTETDRPIKRVAVCSGAGGSTLPLAIFAGCDALITGDIKHDVWIDAVNRDFCLIDAGHFHTEIYFAIIFAVFLAANSTIHRYLSHRAVKTPAHI